MTARVRITACALKEFDSYDIGARAARDIWVSIVPDQLTEPTAELAVGLAIDLARHVRAADAHVRSGAFAGWRPTFHGTGLAGSTVAIVGLGRVGKAIAQRLSGFEGAMLGGDFEGPPIAGIERMDLPGALSRADHVFLAAPQRQVLEHRCSETETGRELAVVLANWGAVVVIQLLRHVQGVRSGRRMVFTRATVSPKRCRCGHRTGQQPPGPLGNKLYLAA